MTNTSVTLMVSLWVSYLSRKRREGVGGKSGMRTDTKPSVSTDEMSTDEENQR